MEKKVIDHTLDSAANKKNLKKRFTGAFIVFACLALLTIMPRKVRSFFFWVVGVIMFKEAEDIGCSIIKRFGFKHNKALGYVDFTQYVSMTVNAFVLLYFMVYSETDNYSNINWFSFVCITTCHMIALLLYIGLKLNGEWQDEKDSKRNGELNEINEEQSRVALLKILLDVMIYQWCFQLYFMVGYHLNQDKCVAYLVLSLAVSWWSESMALFFGRGFKGPNWSYFISPKKTWAGFIGQYPGAVAGHLTALLIQSIFPSVAWYSFSSWTSLISFYFVAATASAYGDLFESLFKRTAQVKDSAFLIGVFGGFQDKWDSMSFVLCVTSFYIANGWVY